MQITTACVCTAGPISHGAITLQWCRSKGHAPRHVTSYNVAFRPCIRPSNKISNADRPVSPHELDPSSRARSITRTALSCSSHVTRRVWFMNGMIHLNLAITDGLYTQHAQSWPNNSGKLSPIIRLPTKVGHMPNSTEKHRQMHINIFELHTAWLASRHCTVLLTYGGLWSAREGGEGKSSGGYRPTNLWWPVVCARGRGR
jgi:hypothetical protein